MKKVERSDVLGLGDYEAIRDRFRTRVIAEKKRRRVALGKHVTAVFENRDSVLMQIQEMLRTERITREAAILHEIETYNDLVPGDCELSVTLMIEIDERETRETFLTAAKGFEEHVYVAVDGARLPAKFTPPHAESERTTAVHYLKFDLPENAVARLRGLLTGAPAPEDFEMTLGVAHPAYTEATRLPPAMVQSLAEDLLG